MKISRLKLVCFILGGLFFGGVAAGQVRSLNIGTERAEKKLFHPPVRLTAASAAIDQGESWGHCGPWVEDVDGDGVKDLIVGDFSGYFRFYRNEGTNQKPRNAKAVNLKAGGVDAQVPIY